VSDIPSRPEQLSVEWMNAALDQAGVLNGAKVIGLDHKIIGTGKMGDNARFNIRYEGASAQAQSQAPASVIVKFPAADETARSLAGAQGAYYNEVMFYRHLAPRTDMRTPLIFANDIAEDKETFITVMEDMAPAEPGNQLVGESKQRAQYALAEAAKLAAAFYKDASIENLDYVMSPIATDGGEMGQALLQQYWPEFLSRFGHGFDDECRAFGDLYVSNYMVYATRYQGPKTLTHGDFRSENILFDEQRLCTVDWQTIGLGSVMTDAAYFLGGSVDVNDRRAWERELIAEYGERLRSLGVDISDEECWAQYREQAMHGLLITILGASFSEAAERSDAMFMAMIQRHLQQCVDLNAGEFLQSA